MISWKKNELLRTVETLIAAPSCCPELREAGRRYLSAVGSADERTAADALLREIREDLCTLDQTIPFFESEAAVGIFGAERARALAAHAREIRAKGAKWCDCAACAACVKILENASELA